MHSPLTSSNSRIKTGNIIILDRDHRVTCIDKLYFNEDGIIKNVKMTFDGVKRKLTGKNTVSEEEYIYGLQRSAALKKGWERFYGNLRFDLADQISNFIFNCYVAVMVCTLNV